jgi:hypothetical protein
MVGFVCCQVSNQNKLERRFVLINMKVDEGTLIFAYLVFGLGGITVEGIAGPMKKSAWRGRGT